MAVTFQMDVSRMQRVLREQFKTSKKDARDFLRPVGGQVAYIAMAATPPIPNDGGIASFAVGSQGRIQWKAHQQAGIFALGRDLRKIFVPIHHTLQAARPGTAAGDYLFVGSIGGKRYIVSRDRDKTNASLAELSSIHLGLRNRRGRVKGLRVPYRNHGNNVVEILRYVVNAATFSAYEQEEINAVGWGKAGWLDALQKFGYKRTVPAWIGKHRGKPGASSGLFMEHQTGEKYEVTFGNLVKHIQEAGSRAGVIPTAIRLTTNSRERQLKVYKEKKIARFKAAQNRA